MTRREFEALVDTALRKLPRAFRDKLANVAVVVEDWADDQTLAEMGIEPPDTLYGLYRGVDITRRDSAYGNGPARPHPHLPEPDRGGLRRSRRDGGSHPRRRRPRGRPLLRPGRRDDGWDRAWRLITPRRRPRSASNTAPLF